MGLTVVVFALIFLIWLSFFLLGMYLLIRKRGKRLPPFKGSYWVLAAQGLFLLLFFTEIFPALPSIFFDISLYGSALFGMIYSIKEIKNNVLLALVLGASTIFFVLFIPFTWLIGSM